MSLPPWFCHPCYVSWVSLFGRRALEEPDASGAPGALSALATDKPAPRAAAGGAQASDAAGAAPNNNVNGHGGDDAQAELAQPLLAAEHDLDQNQNHNHEQDRLERGGAPPRTDGRAAALQALQVLQGPPALPPPPRSVTINHASRETPYELEQEWPWLACFRCRSAAPLLRAVPAPQPGPWTTPLASGHPSLAPHPDISREAGLAATPLAASSSLLRSTPNPPSSSAPLAAQQGLAAGTPQSASSASLWTLFDGGAATPFWPSTKIPRLSDRPGPPAADTAHLRTRFTTSFGSHEPACGGRCLLFRDRDMLWATVLFLSVPTGLWAALVAKQLRAELGWGADLAVALLAAACYAFLLLTWLVEPGILPHVDLRENPLPLAVTAPSSHPGASSQPPRSGTGAAPPHADDDGFASRVGDTPPPPAPVLHTYVFLRGRYYDRRVFRAQVSKFTNSCIEQFDHFCPWVGNAVGKRNYRYFFFFLLCVVALSVTVTATSVAVVALRVRENHWSFKRAAQHEAGAVIVAVFASTFGSTLVFLLTYHMRIVARGVTTAEDLKARFPNGNPHNYGCSRNCALVWCGPHWPSRVAEVVADDASGGASGRGSGGGGGALLEDGLGPGSGSATGSQPLFTEADFSHAFPDPQSLEAMMFSPSTPRDATPVLQAPPRLSPPAPPLPVSPVAEEGEEEEEEDEDYEEEEEQQDEEGIGRT